MTTEILKSIVDSPLGKTALGVVVIVLFGLNFWQQSAMRADSREWRDKIFALHEQQRLDQQSANVRQWEALSKCKDATQAVAIALARIEALLFIPPEQRKAAASSLPPKPHD